MPAFRGVRMSNNKMRSAGARAYARRFHEGSGPGAGCAPIRSMIGLFPATK
jgi:hypothetical protein